jgi:hypothetical protein
LIAWVLNASIIGLPLGLWMIDRVPQVLTLKARPGLAAVRLHHRFAAGRSDVERLAGGDDFADRLTSGQ